MNLNLWRQHERRFAHNDYDGSAANTIMRLDFPGSRVCLVAVHGVNHYRSDGSLKPADLYTGGLALSLSLGLRCNAIIVGKRNPHCNPHLGETMVDQLLADYARRHHDHAILDLHGAVTQPDFDIGLGLSTLQSNTSQDLLCQQAADELQRHGLASVINHLRYSARSEKSLTHRLRKRGHDRVLQIEITRPWRDIAAQPQRAATLQSAMTVLVARLNAP